VRRGLDTNVLVYTHLPAMPDHAPVRRFLLAQLQDPTVTLVVTAQILHEFVHVVTDPRRFEPPVTMAEALATARLYLDRSNVDCVVTDVACVRAAFALLEQHALGRNRIADTLFAATLLQHHVLEVITCNPDDFRVFEALTIIDPRTVAPETSSPG
jgi:predicted nucleic acid-binding protein